MTSYCSLTFLGVFLPAAVAAYALSPRRLRPWVLLAASYAFYWEVSGRLILYLVFTTLSIYGVGLGLAALQDREKECRRLEREQKGRQIMDRGESRQESRLLRARFQRRKKMLLILGAALQLAVLIVLKYSAFFASNINNLSGLLGLSAAVPVPSFVLPVGISFYTLQAVSYLADVCRGNIQADRSLPRLALYMAFFPQIMEGPICRYSQTAEQLWEGRPVTFRGLVFGMQRVGFGLLKKIVIADRLNIVIKEIYGNYTAYDGGIIALGMVMYTCQLYMEFSGTMDVVIGAGEIFGLTLPENFRRPFLARSISQFWHRWHITLGTWFKDYIFYPITTSRPLTRLARRLKGRLGSHGAAVLSSGTALFAVWLGNGLWHGAGWSYIFFGMYHFAWIMFENITEPGMKSFAGRHGINRESRPYRIMQIVRTALIVCVGELFFRAEGLRAGLAMFGRMVTDFTLASFRDGTVWKLGMDGKDYGIAAAALLIVAAVHILAERGTDVREKLFHCPAVWRIAVSLGLVLFIIVFGAYGTGYVPVDPIYAGF